MQFGDGGTEHNRFHLVLAIAQHAADRKKHDDKLGAEGTEADVEEELIGGVENQIGLHILDPIPSVRGTTV